MLMGWPWQEQYSLWVYVLVNRPVFSVQLILVTAGFWDCTFKCPWRRFRICLQYYTTHDQSRCSSCWLYVRLTLMRNNDMIFSLSHDVQYTSTVLILQEWCLGCWNKFGSLIIDTASWSRSFTVKCCALFARTVRCNFVEYFVALRHAYG